jgi:hypothetical protein
MARSMSSSGARFGEVTCRPSSLIMKPWERRAERRST